MDKVTAQHAEALDFLTLLPGYRNDRRQEGTRGKLSFGQYLSGALAVYALTVTGASAALFLLGVLLRHW